MSDQVSSTESILLMATKFGAIFKLVTNDEKMDICLVSDPFKKPIIIEFGQIDNVVKSLYLALHKAVHYYHAGDHIMASYPIGRCALQQGQRPLSLHCIVLQTNNEVVIYIGKAPFKKPHQPFPIDLNQVQFTCCKDHKTKKTHFKKGYCPTMSPVGFRFDPVKDNVFQLCHKLYLEEVCHNKEKDIYTKDSEGRIVQKAPKTLRDLWCAPSKSQLSNNHG